jgi:hypothetical protein
MTPNTLAKIVLDIGDAIAALQRLRAQFQRAQAIEAAIYPMPAERWFGPGDVSEPLVLEEWPAAVREWRNESL